MFGKNKQCAVKGGSVKAGFSLWGYSVFVCPKSAIYNYAQKIRFIFLAKKDKVKGFVRKNTKNCNFR